MASPGFSIIEVGSVHPTSANHWRTIAAAIAGAAAGLILVTFIPQTTQLWTATATPALRVVDSIATPKVGTVPVQVFQQGPVQVSGTSKVFAAGSADIPESTTSAPLLLAASGILFLAVAAIRRFTSTDASEYQALSMAAVTSERAWERRERERAEQAQREVQERLRRLAAMGALPDGMPKVAPAPAARAAAPAPVSYSTPIPGEKAWERAEREKKEKAQRELQERMQRLAAMGALSEGTVAPAPTPAPAARQSSSFAQPSRPVAGEKPWERAEREKKEKAQRELQERMQRLAAMGALPAGQVIAAPAPAAAPAARSPSPAKPHNPNAHYAMVAGEKPWQRAERLRKEAAEREVQERIARLASLK